MSEEINLRDLVFGSEPFSDGILHTTDTTTIQPVKLTTKREVESKIKEAINEYDSHRLFSDDILGELLEDKIREKTEEIRKEEEIRHKHKLKKIVDWYKTQIRNVYFAENQGLTVVIWADGTRTQVKCQQGDTYNPEVGLALCILKASFGNTNYFNELIKYGLEIGNNNKKKAKKDKVD